MMGRIEGALQRFEEARKHYLDVGAPGATVEVDAWEAEARLLAGESKRALEMCGDVITRLEGGEGVNILEPLVDRLLGYGLMQTGELEAAGKAFERSLEGARRREAIHDVALGMLGHARMHRSIGEPDLKLEAEAGELMAHLGIRAVPAYPTWSTDRSL
jgi:hypothetical protein